MTWNSNSQATFSNPVASPDAPPEKWCSQPFSLSTVSPCSANSILAVPVTYCIRSCVQVKPPWGLTCAQGWSPLGAGCGPPVGQTVCRDTGGLRTGRRPGRSGAWLRRYRRCRSRNSPEASPVVGRSPQSRARIPRVARRPPQGGPLSLTVVDRLQLCRRGVAVGVSYRAVKAPAVEPVDVALLAN